MASTTSLPSSHRWPARRTSEGRRQRETLTLMVCQVIRVTLSRSPPRKHTDANALRLSLLGELSEVNFRCFVLRRMQALVVKKKAGVSQMLSSTPYASSCRQEEGWCQSDALFYAVCKLLSSRRRLVSVRCFVLRRMQALLLSRRRLVSVRCFVLRRMQALLLSRARMV
jgi:hypothetical protein